ncbi:hypothetical protein EV356DRAFT_499417 [Viridothelium virens]|uniref:Uncharacterized protein n=1 Tax=Viridothelium virens TaxID=1048519 RepID=A0A6A6HCQ3_VIRVR|nr:hypothetical protein EV356DRAFT_499417 [Viridothelium virens]
MPPLIPIILAFLRHSSIPSSRHPCSSSISTISCLLFSPSLRSSPLLVFRACDFLSSPVPPRSILFPISSPKLILMAIFIAGPPPGATPVYRT